MILHELGGVDTLIDICGAFMLLEPWRSSVVVCSPVPYGRGLATTAHGPLPTPGPAVLELLRGAPVVGVASGDEIVTPTGAALAAVVATAWGLLPAMTLDGWATAPGTAILPTGRTCSGWCWAAHRRRSRNVSLTSCSSKRTWTT